MRTRLVPALAILLATGCSGGLVSLLGPRYSNGQPMFTGRGRSTPASTVSPAAADPQAYLNRLDGHLRSRGYSPVGAAVRNNTMPANGLMAYALDVQQGQCYAAIAIGDSGTDLNMMLLSPTGQTEGYHVAPDSTPFVQFCARQTGRYVVRLQLSRGTGGYYYLAYGGGPGSDANLTAFMGGGAGGGTATGTPAPQVATLDAETRGRVGQQDTTLASDRFVRAGDPSGLVLAEHEERLFPLNLVASACYAFGTFGGPGTRDTDVFVVDGTGQELVSDTRIDRDAVVRFCPPSDGTYQLRARLYSGSGPVFVAGWVQPRAVAGGPSTPGGPTTTPVTTPTGPIISTTSVAAGGVAEAYALVDIDMQARGYALEGDSQQATLAAGETREFSVTVEREKCYAVVAIGDSSVRNLDVSLLDANGRVVERENETSSRSIVRICSDGDGSRTVRVVAAEGGGAVQFALYEFTRGTRGPFGLSGLTWVRLSEVTSLLDAESYTPSMDFSIETGRLASQGRTVSQALQLQAGRCYAIVVVGGNGVHGLSIRLERGGQTVAENATGSTFPDVRVCADTAGRYDLRITSSLGAGPYAYEVFERAR